MSKQIREVYGSVLAELGDTNENIVVLDADLSGSTKSALFGKAHPERFFNMGIAEQNMVATAAGMSTVGKIPFVNTFTVFLTSWASAFICAGEPAEHIIMAPQTAVSSWLMSAMRMSFPFFSCSASTIVSTNCGASFI